MDEVQYLDDELEGLVAEITEKYDDLKKTDKKLNVSQREDKVLLLDSSSIIATS